MKLWIAAGLILVAGVVGLVGGLSLHQSSTADRSLKSLSTAQLQDEKLRQETRQLQISNDQATSVQHTLLAWAPFVTALGAIAAVGATLWKQASDLATARDQLRDEHDKTRTANDQWQQRFLEDQQSSRKQEEEESLRRFDANLSTVITNLGSVSETLQVNAAAALAAYIKPRYAAFHYDLLTVLLANLRLRPTVSVARVLRSDLERILRMMLSNTGVYGDDMPHEIDLSRATLQRLDLSAMDFGGIIIDVAFADLSEARLADARLFRLRGREAILERAYCSRALLKEARLDGVNAQNAIFHKAILVSASLKQADLRGAQFQESSMQEAHLEGADLRGADFTGANLANSYFRGAQLDRRALRSIARGALRWRDNKNFDEATRLALEREAENTP
jgi:uncharacterized protein YjbI with pentapeptide repeats